MYKIIGSDGRDYGPVNIEQLRQWMAEGRINAQTLVQGENSTDWKALANYPELMASPVPPTITRQPATPVKLPGADKKIAAGLCGILLGGLGIHKFILGYTGEGVTMLVATLCSIPLGIVTCGVGFLAIPAMHIIGLIEGIIYLTKSDEEFVAVYVTNKKGWF